jgi:hypothetical protein
MFDPAHTLFAIDTLLYSPNDIANGVVRVKKVTLSANECFQAGERFLYRIEVGRVGREILQSAA